MNNLIDNSPEDNDFGPIFANIMEGFEGDPAQVSFNPPSSNNVINVYLAGPIEQDLTVKNPYSIDWRNRITELYMQDEERVFEVFDPNDKISDGVNYILNSENEFYYNPFFIFRDCNKNVQRSDVVIANFSNLKSSPCFGAPFELGYAYGSGIPTILLLEKGFITKNSTKIVKHPFAQSFACVCYSLQEAVDATKYLFS
jgi:nucleoside 2-deoxyribosyltransferase